MDTSGHHLVYGELIDYLTGETLQDTDDERTRQEIFHMMVEQLGYAKEDLLPRQTITTEYADMRVVSKITLVVQVNGQPALLLRYAPGSLVTREKAAIAAARVLDAQLSYPLLVVTNGRDAELLESGSGNILGTGMACIPHRQHLEELLVQYPPVPYKDADLREKALRILNIFDIPHCCFDMSCNE